MRRIWPVFLIAVVILAVVVWRTRPRDRAIAPPQLHTDVSSPESPEAVAPQPHVVVPPRTDEDRRKGLLGPPPPALPVSDPVSKGISWLIAGQNADGSWGIAPETVGKDTFTKAGATSLAVMALSGGNAPEQGEKAEAAVRRALEWLKQNPTQDDPLNAALVALALLHARNRTGNAALAEAARQQVATVLSLQRPDGSWKGDGTVNAWVAEMLSASWSLSVPGSAEAGRKAGDYAREVLEAGRDPIAARAYVMFTQDRRHPGLGDAKRKLLTSTPDWRQQDYTYWYLGTIAVPHLEGGGSGPGARSWISQLKGSLETYQNPTGSWVGNETSTGNAVRNSLALMALEYAGRIKTR